MTDSEHDIVYTRLCNAMAGVGEASASLFLARFALLAIDTIGDRDVSLRLIEEAREGMTG